MGEREEGGILCGKYKGGGDWIVWGVRDEGVVYMDGMVVNGGWGGGGFEDGLMERKV